MIRRLAAPFLLVILLFSLGMAAVLWVEPAESIGSGLLEGSYVPNELLVGLKPAAARQLTAQVGSSPTALGVASLDRLNARYKLERLNRVFAGLGSEDALAVRHGLDGVIRLTFPQGTDIFAALADYAADPAVDFVELNRIYQVADVPDDTDFAEQWALNNTGQTGGLADADIDAPEAWDIELGEATVLIAVIDTGVDYTHEELAGGRVRTDIDRDFINGDEDAMDDHGHGTFVSGIAAANANNAKGIAGLCRGCQILPVKVLNADGSGTSEQVAQGIQYAASAGARVLSMSLGYPSDCGCSETVARTINYAYEAGAFLVAASGNDGDKERLSYPAASPRVFSVGASDYRDEEADYSNRAFELNIVAPGTDILSLDLDNGYRVASGTSAATPYVAGVAGLLLSLHPHMTNVQLWSTLFQSADDFPASTSLADPQQPISLVQGPYLMHLPVLERSRTTFGRLNAHRALVIAPRGSFLAPEDHCTGEPTCAPGCGAEASLADSEDGITILRRLRAFRDDVLHSSQFGRRWIDHYETIRLELATLLAFNSDLRHQSREAIDLWLPLIDRLLAPEGVEPAVLTAPHLDAAEALVQAYATHGSPEIQSVMAEASEVLTQLRQYVGQDAVDVWRQLQE